MDEFDNPFRPGAGTRPPALLGRDALIEHFSVVVRRAKAGRPGKSVMPIGLRGVGKTVLLNRFGDVARDEGLSVGLIEADESGDFRQLLAGRLRKMLLDLDAQKRSAKVLRAMRVLKTFSYQLPDGSKISLDVEGLQGAADSGILSEDVADLLCSVGDAAQERDTGLLLAVDEVQYLSGTELSALIMAIHATTQRDLPVVLVGAGLPQLPGLTGDARTYAERLFEFPPIGSLEGEDAFGVLQMPVIEHHVAFTDDALRLVADRSGGYPYFLQEWGYHLWNAADTSPIGADLVEAVTSTVEANLDNNFFRVRFDRLTPEERRYLRAMAELGPGPHRSGDIAHELGVRVQSVAPRRAGLITKGMIFSPAHGDTAFTVPLFDDFLRRTTPW